MAVPRIERAVRSGERVATVVLIAERFRVRAVVPAVALPAYPARA